MNEAEKVGAAPVKSWLAMPMEASAEQAIERVRRAEDVVHVAVMPDVHLAGDVCVGTAMATRRLVYPSAVGGDIGCGILAMKFDSSADPLRNAGYAGRILRLFGERIPTLRRHRSKMLSLPDELRPTDLSNPALQSLANGEGRLQFGTLGGGNHFVEFQADESDQLWLMIHSGSRAIGQAVRGHHLSNATIRSASMMALDTDLSQGQTYLRDQEWARQFADANRRAMGRCVMELFRKEFRIELVESSVISCDHNHVRREEHFGQSLLVHRKGAMPADGGLAGAVPGSMGTMSVHVEGRGCADALQSSAHGAGRLFSRTQARQRFSSRDLQRQMQGVWYDPRMSQQLREESPRSYKDIRAVMRAQRHLVKITRTLTPLLVYKGSS